MIENSELAKRNLVAFFSSSSSSSILVSAIIRAQHTHTHIYYMVYPAHQLKDIRVYSMSSII